MKKTMIWAGLAVLAIAAVGGALAMRSGEKGSAATSSANNAATNSATNAATNAAGSAESTTGAAKKQTPPLEFAAADLVTLAARPIVVELAMPGSVQALSQATVRSKLSAEVRQVRVREGERVTAGQVLAQFDTAALQVQLAERTATLASAHAQLAQSERVRGANAQLVKQNFISQNAFDTADAAYRAQAAAVEAAQAQLAQTQLALSDAVVRAPIAGYVAKRHVQPGEKVGFDAPLVGIVDLSKLEVQAQAPVSDVAQIVPGARALVAIEGLPDRRFEGRVERVNPSTEPGTRSINFFVSLPNEGALLRAGMFARVHLHVGSERAVPALPVSAVRNDNGQDIVWVLADGRLRKTPVTLGRRDERAQMVEIRNGVSTGERVVATKFDNLRDGLAAQVIGGADGAARVAQEDKAPSAVRSTRSN